MSPQVASALWLVLVPSLTFCAILITIEVAYQLTRSRDTPIPGQTAASAVAGVAFSLLALVLAFAYSDAGTRLQTHRGLAVEEANAIHGVWRRLDLLDDIPRGTTRDLLLRYTDQRILAQEVLPDAEAFERHRLNAEHDLRKLWDQMIEAVAEDPQLEEVLLLPPVLDLQDVAVLRTLAVRTHISSPAFVVMFLLALVCAALVGVTTAKNEKRNWPYRLVLAAGISSCIYVVVDMEYPRTGIDQAAKADELLLEVRERMR